MSHLGEATRQAWVSAALERFESRLLRYAQKYTGDPERARDVVQDTFLKLCQQDPAALNGRLAQWLYTVCRNQALDVRRKQSRLVCIDAQHATPTPSRESGPAEIVENDDSASLILHEIARLTENQQECLRLKFQHSLSYREISEITRLSVSNVGFLIHTGLKRVRERIALRSQKESPAANPEPPRSAPARSARTETPHDSSERQTRE